MKLRRPDAHCRSYSRQEEKQARRLALRSADHARKDARPSVAIDGVAERGSGEVSSMAWTAMPSWSGASSGSPGCGLAAWLLLGLLVADASIAASARPALIGASLGGDRRLDPPGVQTFARSALIGAGGGAAGVRVEERRERQLQAADTVRVDASIRTGRPYHALGPSFLGLSQEWPWIGSLTGNDQLISMVKRLASHDTGPMILRVGGASADHQTTVPPPSVFDGLSRLHREAGVRYILNLNLAAANVSLTGAQFTAAKRRMPASSIVSFELGNEPNYYFNEGHRSDRNWLNDYPSQFRNFGQALACTTQPCDYRQFAGPAWGHVFMKPESLNWVLGSTHSLLNRVTVHFYKATRETYNDPVTMLDEPELYRAMDSLRKQVNVAERYGLPLIVGESNSISNGGRPGVSDTFSAALWALDATFHMGHVGAKGVNYHQASNYQFFELVKDSDRTRVYPRPVYLAYLMFQEAARGNARLLDKDVSGPPAVKVWPVKQGDEVRVVVVNKQARSAMVHLTLDSSQLGTAKVARLLAPTLSSKKGVTLAGQSYDNAGGSPEGERRDEVLRPSFQNATHKTFPVRVDGFSAALIETKRVG